MQRGSNRLSVHKDDEMKHELQELMRSGRPTRAEEWYDPEPGADDDPEVTTGPVAPLGAVGEAEALRFELARHLGRTPFPARRGALLHALHQAHAPDRLIEVAAELPEDRVFRTVQEVVAGLGLRPST
ncbi:MULTISPECIES: DUF2795 domain-containing protein [Streptomyces]|uniref:DUF2795 domain-containing protein n=1 Tax=Streptomyces lonegramiae TaxID=3075524 RepID=A0ABU2XSI9_9ACTN|nr:DUF2795 domain-containing protein [Streptomyces sp. DSM 41529]MDT0547798.1 DUF2795 domain-containing protein [Streptomyces sp. DSM 41529]